MAVHFVADLDGGVIAHDDDTDCVGLEVEGDAGNAGTELDQLVGGYVGQTAGQRHAVIDRRNRADAARANLVVKGFNLFQ